MRGPYPCCDQTFTKSTGVTAEIASTVSTVGRLAGVATGAAGVGWLDGSPLRLLVGWSDLLPGVGVEVVEPEFVGALGGVVGDGYGVDGFDASAVQSDAVGRAAEVGDG
jgi:hypothetical protein